MSDGLTDGHYAAELDEHREQCTKMISEYSEIMGTLTTELKDQGYDLGVGEMERMRTLTKALNSDIGEVRNLARAWDFTNDLRITCNGLYEYPENILFGQQFNNLKRTGKTLVELRAEGL